MTPTAKRIGFLVPAANTTVEAETARASVASSWTAHYQRLPVVLNPETGADAVLEGAVSAAAALAAARVDIIGLAYTAGSYLYPEAFDDELPQRVERATGRRAVTAAAAVVDRLRGLGIERVAVVSPYASAINDACRAYLVDHGFRVTAVIGEPPEGPASDVPTERVAELVSEATSSGPDGVLVSCTALRTLAALDDLGEIAGVPVTSSNQALINALAGRIE